MSIRISPSEWEVLNVLWDRSPLTASEVYQALSGDQEWHPKTVNTFLARLTEKGVLDVRREGKVNVYEPKLSRESCVQQESESFLQRVFRGAFAPMLLHFVESADLKPEEIRELERLLKQKKNKP